MSDFTDCASPWVGEGGTPVYPQYILKEGDTMTGVLTLSGDPVNPLESATKQYVDTLWGGPYALENHTHTGVYEPANANIQTHIADGTIHFVINDNSAAADVAWSGFNLDAEFSALSSEITNNTNSITFNTDAINTNEAAIAALDARITVLENA